MLTFDDIGCLGCLRIFDGGCATEGSKILIDVGVQVADDEHTLEGLKELIMDETDVRVAQDDCDVIFTVDLVVDGAEVDVDDDIGIYLVVCVTEIIVDYGVESFDVLIVDDDAILMLFVMMMLMIQ